MPRIAKPRQISAFDHMVLSMGGRTEDEFEARMVRERPHWQCAVCAAAADMLYRLVIKLEARANRTAERSHRRIA